MRDVIQGLVAAEAEAKQLIQSARDEAGRVVQEAQKRAQDLAARMRAETRADVEKILQGAVAEAQGIKEQRLLKARSEIAGRMQLDAGTTQAIVQAVVDCVCGGECQAARSSLK